MLRGLDRRAGKQGGFTLVEVTVAGALLVIGILGGISVFDSSRRESATGERQQVAALQAQEELERLRDVPYSELELDPDPEFSWQPSDGPGDPLDRVVPVAPTSKFYVAPGQADELVVAAAEGTGIRAYSQRTLALGDTTLDFNIYRFVTWKDEECPIADLSGLIDPLDTSTDLVGGLLGSGGALDTLLGPLFGLLNPVIRGRLTFLETMLTDIQGSLNDLADALEEIDEIDPCDADVQALQELQETLGPLNPLLDALDDALLDYRSHCTLFLCPGTGSSYWIALNAAITNLQNADFESSIEDLIDSLGELSLADHTHNTKRVTVAVVLEPRTGSGPSKPVWATSIVSDPDAGLLAGP